MKKTFEFSADDEKYMLKNTNPNEKKAEFVISKKEMQFDTNAFQTVDKALLLQGFAIVGTAFLI